MSPRLLSWSGGKDAAWTLHAMRQRGDDVVALLTTITDECDRVSMQGIRRDILHAQADATGLVLIEARIPAQCDNATYEASFADALSRARERWPDMDTIAFGDLFLADVRAWRESLCERLGWRIDTPLFGRDTAQLAREMHDGGLRARLCCVDTEQLDARFAGLAFDAASIAQLPELRSLRRERRVPHARARRPDVPRTVPGARRRNGAARRTLRLYRLHAGLSAAYAFSAAAWCAMWSPMKLAMK